MNISRYFIFRIKILNICIIVKLPTLEKNHRTCHMIALKKMKLGERSCLKECIKFYQMKTEKNIKIINPRNIKRKS